MLLCCKRVVSKTASVNPISRPSHAASLTLRNLDLLVTFLNFILRRFRLDAQDIVEFCFGHHGIVDDVVVLEVGRRLCSGRYSGAGVCR